MRLIWVVPTIALYIEETARILVKSCCITPLVPWTLTVAMLACQMMSWVIPPGTCVFVGLTDQQCQSRSLATTCVHVDCLSHDYTEYKAVCSKN
jgi:hypothetical protein